MKESIVLIGPLGVGKSTIAELVSTSREQPRCCFDELKLDYLTAAGFELEQAHAIRDSKGVYEMWLYSNDFRIVALERLFDEYPNHIIDLGAGDHCFEQPDQVKRAQHLFNQIGNSILLMPSKDLATSIRLLPGVKEQRYMNTFFIMHELNSTFAKHTLYTQHKSANQTAEELGFLLQAGGQ